MDLCAVAYLLLKSNLFCIISLDKFSSNNDKGGTCEYFQYIMK